MLTTWHRYYSETGNVYNILIINKLCLKFPWNYPMSVYLFRANEQFIA